MTDQVNAESSTHTLPGGTVTFLLTDIEGSTNLLSLLKERYPAVLAEHHRIMRQAFAKWNGQEVVIQGDSFFAVFPRAIEAVNAVVEIQQELAAHNWPEGVEVRVRMGLHTGEPWLSELGYMGMDVHRAARIAHAGHGGQVLLSETTSALVQQDLPDGISLLDMGYHQLKDMSQPEELHQLVIPGLPSKFPPLRVEVAYLDDFAALHTPHEPTFLDTTLPEIEPVFVERSSELDHLEKYLKLALESQGGVAFLSGDVGVGKTTLLDRFTRRAIQEFPQLLVACGVCTAYSGIGDPYLPFIDIFSMLTGDLETRWSTGAISRQHALRMWDSLPGNLDAILAHAPDLIGVLVFPGRIPVHPSALLPGGENRYEQLARKARQKQQYRSEMRQAQIFEECVNVLKAIAERQPLVLVLDDLQWADAGSMSLLEYLGKRINNDRILIIGAYRPAETAMSRFDDRLSMENLVIKFRRQDEHILVDLDAIQEQENREFVEEFLNLENNCLERPFREAFYQHTGGHPLFAAELLRNMKERAILFKDQTNCWTVRPDFDLSTLPPRIEGVIEERMEGVGRELRELLEVASVEGVTFTAQVLAIVLAADEYTVLKRLSYDLSKRYRLIREAGELEVGGRKLSRFTFSHNLFQTYLHSALNPAQRRLMHERIASVLETLYAGHVEDIAASLVYHFSQVGNSEKTIHYLMLAGDKANRRYAYPEVIETYSRALELLQKIEQPLTSTQRRQHLYCHIRLGQAYRKIGQIIECQEHLQAALKMLDRPIPASSGGQLIALTTQFGIQTLHRLFPALFLDKIGESSERADLIETAQMYSLMAELYFVANDELPAIYCNTRALNLAEKTGPSPVLAETYAQMSLGAGLERLHWIARIYQRLTKEVIRKTHDAPTEARMAFINSLYEIGNGRWVEVDRDLKDALVKSEALGDWNNWEYCMVNLANNSLLSGDISNSLDLFEQLVQETRRRGNPLLMVWGMEGIANHKIRKGNNEEAIRILEDCLAHLARTADQITEFEVHGMLALARLRMKAYQEASDAAESAMRLITRKPTSYSMFQGFNGVTEVFLELWSNALQHMEGTHSQAKYRRLAAQALHQHQKFAQIFSIGKPDALRFSGMTAWLAGSPDQAVKNWQASLAAARALQMPYETGKAYYELGSHPIGDPKDRQEYLEKAIQLFSEVGSSYNSTRAELELSKLT